MYAQGSFTPATDVTDRSTVPIPDPTWVPPNSSPNPGAPDNYWHGQTWRADADGFLLGEEIFRNDTIFALNYYAQEAWGEVQQFRFDFASQNATMSLNCENLICRLDLRDPDEPPSEQAAAWDVALWDEEVPSGNAGWSGTWDDWYDVSDRVRGVRLVRGRTTGWDDIQVGQCTVEFDNSDGFFSVYSDNGNTRFQLNTNFFLGANWRGVEYPLFTGGITVFDEDDLPNSNGVIITANDATSRLSDPMSAEYNPGVPDQLTGSRIAGLLQRSRITYPRTEIDAGVSQLTNYKTLRNYLDEIRVSALSDGGLFFVDVDGTIVYLDRTRVNGRGGEFISYFSDACNGVDLPYAAIELQWSDAEFGNIVTVANVSQGNDTNHAAKAVDSSSVTKYGPIEWSPGQLVIANKESLQGLADYELSRRSEAFYRVNQFTAYPAHDDRIMRACLGLRIGNPLVVERTPPGSKYPIIAQFICDGMEIEATPELMKFIVFCSPAKNIYGREYGEFRYGDYTYGRGKETNANTRVNILPIGATR